MSRTFRRLAGRCWGWTRRARWWVRAKVRTIGERRVRARRGWAASDAWDADSYLARIISEMAVEVDWSHHSPAWSSDWGAHLALVVSEFGRYADGGIGEDAPSDEAWESFKIVFPGLWI